MDSEPKLKRCLTLFELTLYGVGLILGAGIYVLIGTVAGIAGNMAWLSFITAAVVAAFTALSYAELSSLFPESAAEFLYVKKAFKSDFLAWLIGFVALFSLVAGIATVAVGFAKYFSLFFALEFIVIAFGLIIVLGVINFWGIKESAKFNVFSTLIEAGGLLLVVLVGGYFIFSGDIPLADLFVLPFTPSNAMDFFPPIFSAAALIFFAYLGFEDLAKLSDEAQNPEKNIPKAFIYSLIISTILYILVAVVVVSVIPFNELAASPQPLSLVLNSLIGGFSAELIAVIALFATANTVLAMLIAGSRMLYGMAEEKSMPSVLSRVHSKRRTPWIAIIVISVFSILFLAFGKIEILASLTDFGIFVLFFFVNLSAIILRFKLPELKRPWKMPFNIGKIPLLSVLGCISCIALLSSLNHPVNFFGMELSALIIGTIVCFAGIPLYFLIGKKSV
ncbi:MAG: amino acid permease [Candidatus Diapherotrites archaeon]|nr:amino acid permease [Candidatus Diapherotrites archaeon]